MIRRALAGLLLLLHPFTAAAGTDIPLRIDAAYVRVGPQAKVVAGYLVAHNDSDRPVDVVAAEMPGARRIELHVSTLDGGMMRMREVEQISVPARGSLDFERTGTHFMIFYDDGPPAPGASLSLTLRYADGRTQVVPVAVRALTDDAARQDAQTP